MMTNAHPSESNNKKEMVRDILLLSICSTVLFLCALTLKNYHLKGQPPLWDSLAYQQQTLQILTNWFEGSSREALNGIWEAMSPAYLLALATSFLLFGFNPISPYIVSAFFGTGCMVAVYLLSRELGSGHRTAFWGVIAFSLLPNFFYQNFLQTRNDFPVAFFIAVGWVFLLRGIKSNNSRLAFLAGVSAGIGTLFKASAPGYVAWGILAFLALPKNHSRTPIKERIKLVLIFVCGAVLTCGWHFLPHFSQIMNYYVVWGNAKSWIISQYSLQANWTDHFFYLKNIIFLHLGEKIFLGITLVSGVLLIRWFVKKRSINFTEKHSKELPLIFLVLMAGILPLIFISLRGSFASVGDIPVLPLLAAGSIAFASRISTGVLIPKFFLVCLLPVGLVISLSNVQIAEKPFSVKNHQDFSIETLKIREEFGLGKTPMMQVFSHPIYDIDSLAWSWLMNPEINRNLIPKSIKRYQLMFPEEGETIATKLKRFPLLIISEFPGTAIQGEKFNTLNRLHTQINLALQKQGQFLKLRSMDLEEGRFPIHFMLNKNYSVLRPIQFTTDNWVEWEGEVQYFASRPAKLIWRGIPIRKMESFQLINRDNPASAITLHLNKILPDGGFEYQSKTIAPTKKARTFIVTPESLNHLLPASKTDKRMLAFHKVETEVVKYD